ncbi:MAG: hypothetical protein ACM3NQ_08390 [Bacteroidales bacterium]
MNDGGAAAHAAEIAQAIKASGAIVQVEPSDFYNLVSRQREPLVVHAAGGFLSTNYQYLSAYKGLIFYTKSSEPLTFPPQTEVMTAKKIWIPG